jgi:hypothetical protein
MFMATAVLNTGLLAQAGALSTEAQAAPTSAPSAAKPEPSSKDDRNGGWLPPGEDPQNRLLVPFVKHRGQDQISFWQRPFHLRTKDLRWIAPFAAMTGTLIASDSWISKQVPDKPNQIKRSKDVSNYAVFSLIGIGGGSFLLGHMTNNDHLRETGLLTGEAAIDSTAAAYFFKEIAQRPRPYQGNGHGSFFQGGTSFPSEHAAIAWSIASLWAHEYPGKFSQILAYGLASTVTLTRVTGQQHFASDAFIGSALGWYFGRSVYRAHHDPELGGGPWGDLFGEKTGERFRDPKNMGSPYVPIDSWVYPVFDRLIAMGYIQSAYVGLRPWTRMECARLLQEAGDNIQNADAAGPAQQLYDALTAEFAPETGRLGGAENLGASVDSLYTRFTSISGTSLRDGYHFGQTIVNDYGRPYGEGANNVTGVTAHAVAGPLSVSVQAEYQHAPAVASDPQSVLQATANQDLTIPLPNGVPEINRLRLLESSIGVTYKNIELSFGTQSLWLGPGNAGPFLFSNNAEPIPMLRIDRVTPLHVHGLSRILGPMRAEFFFGRLSGQKWIFSDGTLYGPNIDNLPFIHGEKIGFKPTPNLEFGMGITTLFGGPALPVTWHNFFRTFTSFNVAPGSANDPGDRRSTFDFSYRVPYLRDSVSIYADSYVEDEISPLGSTRPSMRMGMYFAQIPKVPKLELRMEGLYTDVPGQKTQGFIYWNGRYRSGYTNDGNLIASWIGRQGRGGQAWLTYWLSARDKIELSYRHAESDKVYIGGGRLNDYRGGAEFQLRRGLSVSGFLQYEQWNFPVLNPTSQSNVTASVQLTFHPHIFARN